MFISDKSFLFQMYIDTANRMEVVEWWQTHLMKHGSFTKLLDVKSCKFAKGPCKIKFEPYWEK